MKISGVILSLYSSLFLVSCVSAEFRPCPKPIFDAAAAERNNAFIKEKSTERVKTDVDVLPEPIVRIPGIIPPGSEYSGKCRFNFDIDVDGKVANLDVFYCSDDLFKYSTEKAVSKWQYKPAIKNNMPIYFQGLTSELTYRLYDSKGNTCPSKAPS